MKNTLENEMFDAAVSWCCSNGINVLGPEQLASLVNSLYITVRDADPTPANLVLVPLRPTRAMGAIFQQEDWQWADVLAAAESVTEEQYLFALEDDEQAQPEPEGWKPSDKPMTNERARYFMERFKNEEKLLGPHEQSAVDYVIAMLQQAQPERAPLDMEEINAEAREQHGDEAEEYGFRSGVRWAEKRHGIKQGGQHD